MVKLGWYSRQHTASCGVQLSVNNQSDNPLATLRTTKSKAADIGSFLIRLRSATATSDYLLFRNVCPFFLLSYFKISRTSQPIFMEFYEIFRRLKILVKLSELSNWVFRNLRLLGRDALSSDGWFSMFRSTMKPSSLGLCSVKRVTLANRLSQCHYHSLTVSLSHCHCHSVTIKASLCHCHCHSVSVTASLCHCHTVTVTVSLSHPHCVTVIMSLSDPLPHAVRTSNLDFYDLVQ
jgi:hypothetical protein